jgi:hypothetical protein
MRDVLLDTNGLGITALTIRSTNADSKRSVSASFRNVWFLDSQFANTSVGVKVGDSTVNQVSEIFFHRVKFHRNLLTAVEHRGDNTVNIVWTDSEFEARGDLYKIWGGGEVRFVNGWVGGTDDQIAGSAVVRIAPDVGANYPGFNVVPSKVSFVNGYSEMNGLANLVLIDGAATSLPGETAQEYPGKIAVEFVSFGVWCSTPRTLVSMDPDIPTEVTFTGGRFHNITKPAGGYPSSINDTHSVTMIGPTISGPTYATALARTYGLPYYVHKGEAAVKHIHVSNSGVAGLSGYAAFTQDDNGGFAFRQADGDALFSIDSAGVAGTYGHAWNGGHLRVGSYRLWVDSTNRLRKSTGAPGSDTAGAPLSEFVAVPASATAAGVPGQWSADANYLYVCNATNAWERVAIATW